jgi:hypothetical protein
MLPVFTRYDDGRILVDEWQREVVFSELFLNYGITNNLTGVIWKPSQNTVTITCSNGRAVYQLSEPDGVGNWKGKLIEAAIDVKSTVKWP